MLVGLLIAAPAVFAGVFAAAFHTRRRPPAATGRLDPQHIELVAFPEGGVLVQVASPASAAARSSLNRLARVVAETSPSTLVVEFSPQRAPAALRALGVPVVAYVDSSGRIARTWDPPPPIAELRALLAGLRRYEPAVAGSR
jgi:hypothetical protein